MKSYLKSERAMIEKLTRRLNQYSLIRSLLIAASFLLRNEATASSFVRRLLSHLLSLFISIWKHKKKKRNPSIIQISWHRPDSFNMELGLLIWAQIELKWWHRLKILRCFVLIGLLRWQQRSSIPTFIILSLKFSNCLFSLQVQAPSTIWILFAQTCDWIFTMDCKHFRVVMAWRLTFRPRIIAWSFTIPFSARKAFLACRKE